MELIAKRSKVLKVAFIIYLAIEIILFIFLAGTYIFESFRILLIKANYFPIVLFLILLPNLIYYAFCIATIPNELIFYNALNHSLVIKRKNKVDKEINLGDIEQINEHFSKGKSSYFGNKLIFKLKNHSTYTIKYVDQIDIVRTKCEKLIFKYESELEK